MTFTERKTTEKTIVRIFEHYLDKRPIAINSLRDFHYIVLKVGGLSFLLHGYGFCITVKSNASCGINFYIGDKEFYRLEKLSKHLP